MGMKGDAVLAKKKLTVRVVEAHYTNGPVGPCSHEYCDERALIRVALVVGGIEVLAWVCDGHYDKLTA